LISMNVERRAERQIQRDHCDEVISQGREHMDY